MPLYNIFKTKTTKTKPKILPTIIADIHEKNSLVLSELKSSEQVQLEIQSLKIGDYLIGNTIIERKTISDFISSMLNKRLVQQLNQMQIYPQKILVIEGKLDLNNQKNDGEPSFLGCPRIKNHSFKKRVFNSQHNETNLNSNAIRGFILSILTHHQILIIQTQDYEDTSKYLITLARQQLKKPVQYSLHQRIPKTIKEQKQYILESFPNIGPKKAELLLKKFNTLKNTINATEKELEEILKNQTKNFKEILNS